MAREIKGRFSKGKIEPREDVDLEEGEEVTVMVKEKPSAEAKEAFKRAAGAWKGTLDFDAFLRDLYASRREPSRDVRL